jgi:NitT/TauT family transport system substrate-binding protein
MRRYLAIFSIAAGFIAAAVSFYLWNNFTKDGVPTSRSTTVYLGWLYSGAYAGEALAAQDLGAEFGINIALQQGGIGLDPLRLVVDGTFGIASADEVLKVIANNDAPLGIIAVLNDDTPAAFATLKSSGIRTPKDFIGKRVGLLPFGSTRLIYLSLLTKLNIPRDKITEVNITPDLRPFVTGSTHDVQPVYTYDEPVTLEKQGIPYTLILPVDYGVQYKGPVYFTTLATIQKDPELVSRFLRATMAGWRVAAMNPERAIAALAVVSPTIDKVRELEVLRRALPYYVSPNRNLFDSDPATWQPMLTALLDYNVLTKPIAPPQFLFLDQARVAAKLTSGDAR